MALEDNNMAPKVSVSSASQHPSTVNTNSTTLMFYNCHYFWLEQSNHGLHSQA
jgi:hypothetical protein